MCGCHGPHHCHGWWYWDEPYPLPLRSLRPIREQDAGEREGRELLESRVRSLEKELEELKKGASEGRGQ